MAIGKLTATKTMDVKWSTLDVPTFKTLTTLNGDTIDKEAKSLHPPTEKTLKTGYFDTPLGHFFRDSAIPDKLWQFKYIEGSARKKWVQVDPASVGEEDTAKKYENDTQKVRGIRHLEHLCEHLSMSWNGATLGFQPFEVFSLLPDGKSPDDGIRKRVTQWREWQWDAFARPCPKVACHGFLESRRIRLSAERDIRSVYSELKALHKEVQATDSEGQLLLMPYVRAAYNMVLANGMVTIGAYHDGATANRKAITIPTGDIDVPEWLRIRAGIVESPFVEVIASKHEGNHRIKPSLVQLRNGPFLPRCKDVIPETVTVKHVITTTPEEDMLQFMAWAKRRDPDTVVYAGAVNSHVGIHCALNNIPLITSRMPIVGETWEANAAVGKECNRSEFSRGVQLAMQSKLVLGDKAGTITVSQAVEAMLFVLHSTPFFDLSDALQARLLGAACGIGVRLGITACIGEARYVKPETATSVVLKEGKGDRSKNYEASLVLKTDRLLKLFMQKAIYFSWPGWGEVGSGVGGPKWHVCAIVVARLWNAICEYINGASNEKTCISALNAVVNVSHNGALLLTKFANPEAFATASSKRLPFMSTRIVGTLYRFGVNRVPLLTSAGSFFAKPVDIETIMPTEASVMRLISPLYPSFFKELRNIYGNFNVDFDAMQKKIETKNAELIAAKAKLLEAFTKKHVSKLNDNWPITLGCANCQSMSTPFPGSYASWNPSISAILLEPCGGCNRSAYSKSHITLKIIDNSIPDLYASLTAMIKPVVIEEVAEEKDACSNQCDNCGDCKGDPCNCDVDYCICGLKPSTAKCEWVCGECGYCRNSDCDCPTEVCHCKCVVCGDGTKFSHCKHTVNE